MNFGLNIKAIFRKIINKDQENFTLLMGKNFKDIFIMIKQMDKAYTLSMMVNVLKENGIKTNLSKFYDFQSMLFETISIIMLILFYSIKIQFNFYKSGMIK